MAKKPARYAATDENLDNHALEPAMRWLIATALDGSKMTYGEVKHRLETDESCRAVKMAMDVRMGATVQAILVTETRLPGEIAELVKQHDIVHFQAPMKRV